MRCCSHFEFCVLYDSLKISIDLTRTRRRRRCGRRVDIRSRNDLAPSHMWSIVDFNCK